MLWVAVARQRYVGKNVNELSWQKKGLISDADLEGGGVRSGRTPTRFCAKFFEKSSKLA